MTTISKRLKPISFPAKNYFQTMQRKTQIVLHHTASGTATSAINWWKTRNDGAGTVATAYVIDRAGTIFQLFNAFQWAHHLGVAGKSNLDKNSIGIEIVSWGALVSGDITNGKIKENEVVDYGANAFRGMRYYQCYTTSQIESLSMLLPILSSFAGIPLAYNDNIFSLNQDALSGKSGVYTHVSYRSDKSDCHPQKELIEMLKGLT